MQTAPNSAPGENSPPPPPDRRARRRQRWLRLLTLLCWLNLAALLVVWLMIRAAGDRWWPGTIVLFGPRWVWAGPLVLLAPLCLLFKRRLLWLALAAAFVQVFLIMGFCLPWRGGSDGGEQVVRVMNFNMDGPNADIPGTLRFIDSINPDILACQETPIDNKSFLDGLRSRGWHFDPKPGGLFVASRFSIISSTYIQTVEKWRDLAGFFVLHTPAGNINFVALHLETARKGLDSLGSIRHFTSTPIVENMARRRMESEQVSALAGHLQGPILIAGDFNLPPESGIFRDNWSAYSDAFGSAGFGFGYTKFTSQWGVRIDHLLADDGHWGISRCYVGPELGSDHRPLITELRLLNR